jgi:hypothetical protein
MRFLTVLLLSAWMLICASPARSAESVVPSGTADHSLSQAHLTVTRVSSELTSISLESPVVVGEDQTVDYQSYRGYGIPGEDPVMREGAPLVPQVTRFYRIPNTGGAELAITDAEYDIVDGVNPMPVQIEENGFGSLRRDESVYSKDAWYPENVAEMSDPMIMRDFRVVTVTLYPVQVNPVTHQVRIYRRLSVDVVANNQAGTNELTNPRRPSGAWAGIYRSMISNLDDNALDNMTTTPGSYMIITSTNANIRQWSDSLAQWKTRKGYKVKICERASWSSTQVYDSIHTAYLNADPPLEFVCLMGDPGWSGVGIPIDGLNLDHTYANMTSGDNIEDIGVGRLSGGGPSTMATINAKIMQYERSPHMQLANGTADTAWFHTSFLYAGTAQNVSSNYLIMRWAKDQFMRHTGVYLDSIKTHSSDQIVNSDVTNQINAGIAFFLWRGTWVGGMPNTIADGTNPGGRLPITMTITCSAGEYSGSGINSPAEDFLCAGSVSNPSGGVCGMGTSTVGTQNGANGILAAGVIYAITDAQVEHLGTVVASAKAQLYSAYGPNLQDTSPYSPAGPIALHFTQFFNLLGDPGLSIWTDVPKAMNVEHPDMLNIGARSVDVTVTGTDGEPVSDALVCLWKKSPDSTWVRGTTDMVGHITLPVSVNSSGTLYLTVTKRNHKPYLYDIPCGQSDCMPMFSSVTLDDDNTGGTQGNGDHVMNPGETIDLPVYLRNFGATSAATSVSATIESSNPHITVVNAAANFPNIAAGDSAQSATPFRIQVDPAMQHLEQALLTITISSSVGQTTGVIPLTCYAAQPEYIRQTLATALNPGTSSNLTVVFRNTGAVPMSGVTGHLLSFSSFVQVDGATASFGDAAAGALDSNATSSFVLSANSQAYHGHQAPMQLILTTAAGLADTLNFVVSVGTAQTTDPSGPDAYGYFAYDNTDAGFAFHPDYSYVDISSTGGTNLNLSDPGEKTNWQLNYSAVRALPFDFKFYGQVYDSITICSNGWCAFGNQSYLDMFRHYQIPAMGTPDAMIAPYFTDLKTTGSGRGVWVMNDTDNHRYIIQWKAFGWAVACTGESGSPGANFTTPLDFEVILYDTTFAPTYDGNGKVLVQYNQVTMNLNSEYCDEPPGCTVGIQMPGNTVGLQYAYQNSYIPGGATIVNGRAILYTTETVHLFGQIVGTVRDAATTQPLAGVDVSVADSPNHATTDNAGHYSMDSVPTGTHSVIATLHRFDPATVSSVVVRLDSTTTVDMNLLHPLMALSVDTLTATIGDTPGQATFQILNAGNGPLDYHVHAYLPGSLSTNPWDSVGNVNASEECGNNQLWGCEFAGNSWWVTGGGGQNMIYRFDMNGNLSGSIPQPPSSTTGWFDLAYDGNYLYGSDSHTIYGVDFEGVLRDSIISPLNPSRAIAFDPASDHFWVADYSSSIYEIDRQGAIVQQVPNSTGLPVTGLAWNALDASGYKLYLFSADTSGTRTHITRMQPIAPFAMQSVVDLSAPAGDQPGGCTVTGDWNNTAMVLGALMRGASGADHLEIYQISVNMSWLTTTPSMGDVPGGGNGDITAHFNPATLHDGVYRVDLRLSSETYDSSLVLPVRLTVHLTSGAATHESPLPVQYALRQNYPNPFNPSTNIRYELKTSGLTELNVYNILGEKVANLVHAQQPAGYYDVHFDASALPSGIYFYRLTSGSFTRTAKMILMK